MNGGSRGTVRVGGCREVLAPRSGFEPATIRLTVECSTAELPRNRRNDVRERAAYNKADPACIGGNRHRQRSPASRGSPWFRNGFVALTATTADALHSRPKRLRVEVARSNLTS